MHFLDVSGEECRNPVDDFYTINKELKKYSEKLSTRKQIIVATKIDLIDEEKSEVLNKVKELAEKENLKLFKISSATKERNSRFNWLCLRIIKNIAKRGINRNWR